MCPMYRNQKVRLWRDNRVRRSLAKVNLINIIYADLSLCGHLIFVMKCCASRNVAVYDFLNE